MANGLSLSMLNASLGTGDSRKVLADALKKLSGGKRMAAGGSDPAGAASSNKANARIQRLARAMSGDEATVNMTRVAAGAVGQMGGLLKEARSILEVAGKGGGGLSAASSGGRRLSEIVDTVNRIAEDASFGSKKIFSGDLVISPTAGAQSGSAQVAVPKLDAASLGKDATYKGEGGAEKPVTEYASLADIGGAIGTGNTDKVAQALGVVDKAMDRISDLRVQLGAMESDFASPASDALTRALSELQDANNRVEDSATARELSKVTVENIRGQVKMALMSQGKDNTQNLFQLLL